MPETAREEREDVEIVIGIGVKPSGPVPRFVWRRLSGDEWE